MPTPLISSADALAPWLARWRQAPFLAVDTEFIRVDTYHARLCLVQIGDGRDSVCVDTLALPDLAPLLELLHTPSILKVFHSASQDLEIFVQLSGRVPAPLFDTQTAATLLGIGDQIGYAGLVEKMLGIAVDKSLSRTDWARRPLTEPELAYAADDVRHLAVIYPQLHAQLAERGRLDWLAEDCAQMCKPALYRCEPADAWQRLRGLPRLDAAQQTRAAALAAWREHTALARNRPRKWIIDDDALYRIAERAPRDAEQLAALGVLPPKTLERHGSALLEVVAAADAQPPQLLAQDDRYSPEQKARLKALQTRLREIAESLGLPVSVLAPRADLEALMLQGREANIPLLRGWRRGVAGEALLALQA